MNSIIKNSVGYVRVSTLQQVENGTSVEDQKKIIEKESKHRGLNLVKIYSDEGISGKSTSRPALREMLEDARSGNFDTILFTKLDRLARNLRDTLNIYHETKELGIDMICIDDPAISTNGPMGIVMLSILGTFAQFERDLIRSRTTAGRMHKWKSGEAIMGHLPFGYIKNAELKTIEIDNNKKDIVLKIFSLYLIERLSMIDIANRLTDLGYKTPSALNGRRDASQHWNMNTVREILTNSCYTGKPVAFNKHKFKWNENSKIRKSDEEKPPEEWIHLTFPKMIEEELFLEAQQKISYNKSISKRTAKDCSEKFLTLHLLRCGECRAKLSRQTSGSKKYAYYACPWRRCSDKKLKASNKRRCELPFLKYEAIDNQVFNQVVNLIVNPLEFAKQYSKTTDPKDLQETISRLSVEKDGLKDKLKKCFNIETNTNDADLLKIYKAEREKIEEKFASISNTILTFTNELSFFNNRNEQLNKFKKLFSLEEMGDVIRAKKKITKMLAGLPFSEKKKLLDAVISPETGGTIYVSRLSEHHLLPDDFIDHDNPHESTFAGNDVQAPGNESDTLEKSMVIELDFTLDPYKIYQIIQGYYETCFKLDKLLFFCVGNHSHSF